MKGRLGWSSGSARLVLTTSDHVRVTRQNAEVVVAGLLVDEKCARRAQ